MQLDNKTYCAVIASVFAIGLGVSAVARADDHVKGVIAGRGASSTLMVHTDDASDVTVVLGDSTKVQKVDGVRSTRISSANLIAGLRIDAAGHYETPSRFVADRVTFKNADLKLARAIQSGITTTDVRSVNNERAIQEHAQALEQHHRALQQDGQLLAAQQGQIAATDQKIVATSGVMAERFANLDDFTPINSVIVYFGNGKSAISKEGKSQLENIASQAKGLNGYMIQVQAYASATGSGAVNQRLSMERASAVTAVLQQAGIPPTRVAVPAAMGVTNQVAPNDTANGQAQNRRAVVTLMQNKGIDPSKN